MLWNEYEVNLTKKHFKLHIFSRKVMGSFPDWVTPKTLKMKPIAFLLGAQHKRLEQGQTFITGFQMTVASLYDLYC